MTTNKSREIISKINMLLKNAHAENIKIDCAEHNSNILKSRFEVMYSFEIIDNKEHCALPVSRKISVYIEDYEDELSKMMNSLKIFSYLYMDIEGANKDIKNNITGKYNELKSYATELLVLNEIKAIPVIKIDYYEHTRILELKDYKKITIGQMELVDIYKDIDSLKLEIKEFIDKNFINNKQ